MPRILLALAIVFCLAGSQVLGRPFYQPRIPNGANLPGWPGVGHLDSNGGGALNPFGQAFQAAGHEWTKALCQADSDGDGQSNGMELGDPCCVWTAGATPAFTTGLGQPGIKTTTASTSITCSSAGTATPSPSASPNGAVMTQVSTVVLATVVALVIALLAVY